MHVITRSCVLLFWMQTLTFVKSQEHLPDCTLHDFLNGPLFDSNFNTTGLEARYVGGKQIRVSCSTGYSGFFQLLCIEGEWQSRGTICKPQQCPVINVSSNVQVIGDPEEANVGNVVQFRCRFRSEVLIGLQELYCDEKGEWSGEAPVCKLISCLVPVIGNGRVPGNIQEYKENEFLPFQCNPGFQPSEDRPSKCTQLGLIAGWSPAPECKLITCKLELPSLDGTEYDPSSKSVFSPGETVTVTCGRRHWISDQLETSAVVSCKEDGQWSLSPICQEVTCSYQQDPLRSWWHVYREQRKKLWDQVRYGCIQGYKKTGGVTRARCTREGWKPDPLCQAITCDREDIENADIINPKDQYRTDDRANYVCKDGYEGEFYRTCGENGWSGTSQCRAKGCKKPDISEAHIVHNVRYSYSHGERFKYVCNKGDQTRFTVLCEKGVWTGIQSCTAVVPDE